MILLAGRMSIPQEIYDAAKVDGATGLRRFLHVTFPLLANLYLVLTLLATIFLLGDFNSVYFVTGGGPANSTHLLATLGSSATCLELGKPRARRRGGHVGAAAADPAGDHPDAQAQDLGGAAVSTITAETQAGAQRRGAARGADAARRPALALRDQCRGGAAQRRHPGVDADADLQHGHGRRSSPRATCSARHLFPPQPSADSFWVVLTEGYWYLEAFWHQFGNSVLHRRDGDACWCC